MATIREKKRREEAESFNEEHLALLKPLKILDRGRQERFILPDIKDLEGTPFALCTDEINFALSMVDTRVGAGLRKHNLWLYRTHQQKFAGDFILVDVSSPLRSMGELMLPTWDVFVLDLKMGGRLKFGGKGAGNQLKHWSRAVRAAVRATARERQVYPETPGAQRRWQRHASPRTVWRLVGDRRELLTFFRNLRLLRRQRHRIGDDPEQLKACFRRLQACTS
ncbi:MAG: hypothetical protein CMH57_14200 [Myxococcales bacterium]|nr:hypothetical protein [Myxococcales bacterium]